jgi:hypothetical protein
MKADFSKVWPAQSVEAPRLRRGRFAHRVHRMALVVVLCLVPSTLAVTQNTPSGPRPDPEARKCAALAELNLEDVSGGPAIITSARTIEVAATGLDQWIVVPSGYGKTDAQIASRIHRYCDVTGYVAPQNKFELKATAARRLEPKVLLYGLRRLLRFGRR